MVEKSNSIPFVPAASRMAEITPASVVLGIVLGIILSAANAYLGLYAGITVSASIPAAVISMGVLRGLLRRGTILENNIVQTIAASGESLAAGIIFTVPAMLLTGVWKEIEFWPTTLICMTGALLGICFMIPLRKAHIVKDKTLAFPEGVACAEVLKAGEKGGAGALYVLISLLVGAAFKLLSTGTTFIKGSVEWAWGVGRTGMFFGWDVSPALLGVGYIVGINVGIVVALGGAITWMAGIPIYGLLYGVQGNTQEWFWTTWSTKLRYLGVGAMVVAGVWSLITIREAIVSGVREAFLGFNLSKEASRNIPRTDRNMAQKHIFILLILTSIAIFVLYQHLLQSSGIALVSTVLIVVLAFFLVAVGSYVVGLVGSSNMPVSGITICAVVLTGGFLVLMGYSGMQGIIATLGVAGVACCAASSAGDISQDLKTGYIIGATPKAQQWMEVLGAVIPAFVVAPVLVVLQHSYGIGTGTPTALKAPQATLFANLTNGIFGGGVLPWDILGIGALIGVAAIAVDTFLKAQKASMRLPVMAMAVGMYLPMSVNITIFFGSLIAVLFKPRTETSRGVLFSSGLVAGEAIVGVVVGAVMYFNKEAIPIRLPEAISNLDSISVAMFLLLWGLLAWVAKKDAVKGHS